MIKQQICGKCWQAGENGLPRECDKMGCPGSEMTAQRRRFIANFMKRQGEEWPPIEVKS